MEAILRTAREEKWPVQIAAVISNRPDAQGLQIARAYDVPCVIIDNHTYPTRDAFDAELQRAIDGFAPDLVVLAGFMRILTTGFVAHYAGRMLNIHPSLLPSFTGLATHRRALETGVRIHGATVHFVTAELDHGPIVAQAAVPVLADDDEQTLAARVLEQEHIIYPRAIRDFLEGRLSVHDGIVRIADA